MKIFPILTLTASCLTVVSSAQACYNDRDSDALAVQAQKLPDAVRIISGRFERNAPRYYQMRLARVESQLKQNPRQWALYDDGAVALDRLNRTGEALALMNRKRALLPAFNAKDKANKEAWYRTFANAGTVRVHRFLKTGAKIENLPELQRARAEIRRAIQIKPNAHFGREKYQLMAMDWMAATKTRKTDATFANFLEKRTQIYEGNRIFDAEHQKAAEGLSGLIVLGAAWQSVDIFHALARVFNTHDTIALRHLTLLRCEELLKNGHSSLGKLPLAQVQSELNGDVDGDYGFSLGDNSKTLKTLFPQLRAEAENWNGARQNYMSARFDVGAHPDTNADFWNGWKPSAPPSLEVDWINQKQKSARQQFGIGQFLLIVGGVLAGILAPIFAFDFFKRSYLRRL